MNEELVQNMENGHQYGALPIAAISSSYPPPQASLIIDFLVIGGGLTGLIAAYALTRGGHRVTVLERTNFDGSDDDGAFWVPPNMSKIFFRWGLEERVRQIGMRSRSNYFHRYESNEYLGRQIWKDDYLEDTGGDFIFAHASDLWQFAYKLTLEAGVTIRSNAEVVSIDTKGSFVVLSSGETLSAHVIIGADGLDGISRSTLLNGRPDKSTPVGVAIYGALVPAEDVITDPELTEMCDLSNNYLLFGNGRAALGFPLGGRKEIGLFIYAKDQGIESEPTLTELREAAGPIQGRLRKCVERATKLERSLVEERPDLRHWVHDTCPLLLIGSAVHPMPRGSIQILSLSMEDGAALGRLFLHLQSEDQIRSFLYAFQDLRESRCSAIVKQEIDNVNQLMLPDSEIQAARDAAMKANTARGIGIFDGEGLMSERWDQNIKTFSYDPEDDADNWWIKWGALRVRAKELAMGLFDPS